MGDSDRDSSDNFVERLKKLRLQGRLTSEQLLEMYAYKLCTIGIDMKPCKETNPVENADDQERVTELSMQVFTNELILERILGYLILSNGNGKINRKNLSSLRLVNHSWLNAVTRLIRNKGKPLFQLVLNCDNFLQECDHVKKNGKTLLDEFVEAITNSTIHAPNSTPTFSLRIEPNVLRQENSLSFYNCLNKCGMGLLELEWETSNTDFLQLESPLARLRNLTILHGDVNCPDLPQVDSNVFCSLSAKSGNRITRVCPFLQVTTTINHSCSRATCFSTECHHVDPGSNMDSISEHTFFHKNTLPNLTRLQLRVEDDQLQSGVLFTILDKFRATLLNLTILSGIETPSSSTNDKFQFPVMTALETIRIESRLDLMQLDARSFQKCFPKLVCLQLTEQCEAKLLNFMATSTLPTVTDLEVHMKYYRPLSLQVMRRIHATFPNLSSLTLATCLDRAKGLKFMFRKMRQLTYLSMILSPFSMYAHSYFWDALLIGASYKAIGSLKAQSPELWSTTKLARRRSPSIRMMKALERLSLSIAFPTGHKCPCL